MKISCYFEMCFRPLVLVVASVVGVAHAPDNRKTSNTESPSVVCMNDRCHGHYCSLPTSADRIKYLRSLVAKKQYKELSSIAHSRTPDCEVAAFFLSDAMPTADAIELCRTFYPGSREWMSAASVLYKKDRQPVVAYFLGLLNAFSDSSVRVICYRVCEQANWDDLIVWAQTDFANHDMLSPDINDVPSMYIVGDVARHYDETLHKNK